MDDKQYNVAHSYPCDAPPDTVAYVKESARYQLARGIMDELEMGRWYTFKLRERTKDWAMMGEHPWPDHEYQLSAEIGVVEMRPWVMWEPPPIDHLTRVYRDLTWQELLRKAWRQAGENLWVRLRGIARMGIRKSLRQKVVLWGVMIAIMAYYV